MIPLRDVIPTRTTPYVTISLVTLNVLVFLYQFSLGPAVNRFVLTFGLIPAYFSWISVFTSMFLHGGFLHVAGNMLYLWIFGDNVEDRMGHGRFLAFYLLCGVAAALGQTFTAPDSIVPMVGASGAVAGVMGAYFVLYPHSRIVTLLPLFIFIQIIEVPAIFFLGVWFVMQFVSGIGSIAAATQGEPAGGVAFLGAHRRLCSRHHRGVRIQATTAPAGRVVERCRSILVNSQSPTPNSQGRTRHTGGTETQRLFSL
jgi:membrane associated rhomboid family serine protease